MKVDLRKAYDTMEWHFLKDIQVTFEFPSHFVKIIYTCMSTASFSLVINGHPLKYLNTQRGLRQGDPMSPLLFVLGMEYLTRLIHRASGAGAFKFHTRCRSTKLYHLCFADDLMLFCKGELSLIQTLCHCLQVFSQSSGFQANFSKFAIYLAGITTIQQQIILDSTRLPLGIFLSTLRGSPLLTVIHW